MARDADAVLYTRAGPEIGVAATKTHLAQITALEILALYLAQVRETLSPAEARSLLAAMGSLPDKVAEAMSAGDAVHAVAERLPRLAVVHLPRPPRRLPGGPRGRAEAEGDLLPAGRGLPGRRAEARARSPWSSRAPWWSCVATRTPVWEKVIANVAEVKSRGASVVLVANDGDDETARHADAVLWVPGHRAPLRAGHRRGAAADVRPLAWPGSTASTSTAPATWPRRSPSSDPVGGRRPWSPTVTSALAGRQPGDGVVGIGIDAVDIDRFRTVLARRPGPGRSAVHRRPSAPTPAGCPTRCPAWPPASPPRRPS